MMSTEDDVIRGGAGNDTLFGDAGQDLFNGGPGTDSARRDNDDYTPISVEVLL